MKQNPTFLILFNYDDFQSKALYAAKNNIGINRLAYLATIRWIKTSNAVFY